MQLGHLLLRSTLGSLSWRICPLDLNLSDDRADEHVGLEIEIEKDLGTLLRVMESNGGTEGHRKGLGYN